MLRTEKFEKEVKVCDICPEPKAPYDKDLKMDNCFVCGKDLCIEHTRTLGDLNFCSEHHKIIWKFIKNLRKECNPEPEVKENSDSP